MKKCEGYFGFLHISQLFYITLPVFLISMNLLVFQNFYINIFEPNFQTIYIHDPGAMFFAWSMKSIIHNQINYCRLVGQKNPEKHKPKLGASIHFRNTRFGILVQ